MSGAARGRAKTAMDAQLKRYKRYSRDVKWLLLISGVWPLRLHPGLQLFIACTGIVTTSVTFAGVLNFSIYHISNVMAMTKAMGLAFSLFSVILKLFVFLHHQSDISDLNASLSGQFLADLRSEANRSLALGHIAGFVNLFYALTYSVAITSCLTSILIPLLALIQGNYVPVAPMIFPFDVRPGSWLYWMLQVSAASAAFYAWAVTCGADSVFGLYTLQMCGELRILADRFRKLAGEKDYKASLRDCLRRHRLLMRSLKKMESLFGLISIWLAVTSAIIQCTHVFQAIEVGKAMSPFKTGYLLGFITLKLVQAFMYAWYGNLIADESQLCLDAMYNAAWPGSGRQTLMTDALIILSQRPLTFTAKGCMELKMAVFSRIIHTSVTYFFLLQTLSENS